MLELVAEFWHESHVDGEARAAQLVGDLERVAARIFRRDGDEDQARIRDLQTAELFEPRDQAVEADGAADARQLARRESGSARRRRFPSDARANSSRSATMRCRLSRWQMAMYSSATPTA